MTTEKDPKLTGMTIGFIGVGLMGQPMANNLYKAGANLVIPERSKNALSDLPDDRIQILKTPKEITRSSNLVILMLPNAKAVASVCQGSDGVLAGATPQTTVIDMGTTSAKTTMDTAKSLEDLGATFIDAPVTGGRVGATKGKLTIFVGSKSQDSYETVSPLLHVLGSNVTHIGPVGSGQAAKAVNQLINFATQVTVAEGLVLARRAGLDLNTLIPAMQGGAADSVVMQVLGPRIAAEDWSITAHMQIPVKDMDIVLEYAQEHRLDLPMTKLTREQWASASNEIGSEHDIAEFVRFVDPEFSGGGWDGESDAIGSGIKSS